MGLTEGDAGTLTAAEAPRRFFSEDSFWNQPLAADVAVDPRSGEWIALLATERPTPNLGINAFAWTMPVYSVDGDTPRHEIGRHRLNAREREVWVTTRETFGHGEGVGRAVPIPVHALPDQAKDAHLAVVDWGTMTAWDMWGFRREANGRLVAKTGMVYALDGPGVFATEALGVVDGESVHFHGPSRAAGVPIIAGLIRHDEVMAGEIRHKLAFACRFAALQEYVFPAAWTDGFTPGGIPEGAVLQLDPELDLDAFDLWPGERVVAEALQRYGAVLVDVAQGTPLYAEGLWGHPDKSWEGVLREWDGGINSIPVQHYRVIATGPTRRGGDTRGLTHPYFEPVSYRGMYGE